MHETAHKRLCTGLIRFSIALLITVSVSTDVTAQEGRSAPPLFPDRATACFAAGVPASGGLSPLTNITSLIIRPQNPDTDGDGSFPPEVRARLEPERPDAIPLTLIVTYSDKEDAKSAGRRWGARFSCDPRDRSDKGYQCGVVDWCMDVEFDLHIESKDGIRIDVMPDAGSIGELGNSCSDDFRRGLTGSAQARVTYRLNRQPALMCR